MVLKFTLIIVCILSIVTLGAITFLQTGTQSAVKWEDKNSLAEIVRRSKAEGKTKVKVMGRAILYPGRNIDLSEALNSFSLVTAEVIQNKSYPVSNDEIFTWSKLRLLETISAKPPCTACIPMPDIPLDAQPLRTDEFVIINSGGNLTIDGVDITVENNEFPPFVNGQKYLLFVSFTPSKATLLAGGPSGVFRINNYDDLEPIDKPHRPIANAISKRFGRKLSVVKSHIQP